ncbi:MAG: hypothetical protein JWO68_3954 [Actinomycetia bacterium]|nr:hypothetical protein [Actinomycetes bacterium]
MGRDSTAGAAFDDIRLAIAAIRDAEDLAGAFQQLCVGAARVTGASSALLALEHGGRFDAVAAVGRNGNDRGRALLDELAPTGRLVDGKVHAGDPMIVPVRWERAAGALIAQGARKDATQSLALLGEVSGALLDLQLFRTHAATDAHEVQPASRVATSLATIKAGDGLVVTGFDGLDAVRLRFGVDAVHSLVLAAGVHLLGGTRPPGDLVCSFQDDQFLIVLRDLKAPVQVVVQRLLDSWMASRPTASLSVGAALHVDGIPPLDTLEQAERALASAMSAGTGVACIAPPLVRGRHA